MFRNRMAITVLSLCAVMLFVSTASAQNDFYALYNRYLSHHTVLSPRSAAMGGAYSALRGGDMGLLGNPASLGLTQERYVLLRADFTEVSSDISVVDPGLGNNVKGESNADMYNIAVGGSMPFEWGGLGLLYNYRSDDLDSQTLPTSIGRLTQTGDVEDHYISLGGAYNVNEQLAIGYRYSYIDWDSDINLNVVSPAPAYVMGTIEEEMTGHKNHFGLQYLMNDMMTVGFDGYYGFGDYDTTASGDADSDSFAIRSGVAFNINEELPVLFAFDVNFETREIDDGGLDIEDQLWGIHAGLEYEVMENIFFRAGYMFEDFDYEDSLNAIDESPTVGSYTTGIGYTTEQFSVDYGMIFSDSGDDGDFMHIIGVGINF